MPIAIILAEFAIVKNMSVSLLVQVAATYGCAEDLYALHGVVYFRNPRKEYLIEKIKEDYQNQVALIEAKIKQQYARHCLEQELYEPEDVFTDVCKIKRIGR